MSNLLEVAGDVARGAVRRAVCTPWWLASQIPSPTRGLARGIYTALCEAPPPPELGEPAQPFPGGQCNVFYRVFWSFTGVGGGESFSASGDDLFLGPVLGILTEFPTEGSQRGVLIGGGGRFTVAGGALNVGERWDKGATTYVINSVVREDGLSDDCGDPPPGPVLPPGYPPQPPGFPVIPFPPETEPVTDDDGDPGGDYIFQPTVGPIFIDVDGSINVPVNVDIDGPLVNAPVTIPVNIKLPSFSPTINIGGGGDDPGRPDAPCCEPVEEPEEPVEPDPDPVEDPPEQGEKVVGCFVFSQPGPTSKATEIFSERGPTIYAPRLGVVNFRVEVGGETAWSVDYPVKNVRQYIPAPEGATAIAAEVTPSPGVSATLTLVKTASNRR